MKKTTKTIAAVISVLLIFSMLLSGCSLIKVDPERDSAQKLMTVGNEVVTKSVFNNTMASTELYYVSAGGSMPTGKELTALKETVLDSVVQVQVLAAKGKKDKLSVDEAAAKKTGSDNYDSLKKQADKKYNSVLENWCTNDESFKAYCIQNAVDSKYAEAAEQAYTDSIKKNPEDYFSKSVGQVNEEDVNRAEYIYYYIQAFLNAYATSGQALDTTDEKVMQETNTTIFQTIGKNRGYIKYCEENKIDISDKAVNEAQTTLGSNMKTYFQDDSSLSQYLESFNMALTKYKELQKNDAKAKAAADAIKDKMISDVEVSENDISAYFKKHKDEFDKSTVSACHILTDDKNLSNEIYNAAKDCKTKEDFEKVIKEYKEKEHVTEASDLGAFDKSKMVEEFSKKAFSMEVNTVSKPVKTEFGYHVIFVYDKKEEEVTLDAHKDEITKTIKEEKGEEAFSDFDEKLEKEQKVSFDDIKIGLENYIDELKTELSVTVYEDVIS